VEIPLNYRERVGESSVTGDFWKTWKLGWRMIFLVWEYRLGFHAAERGRLSADLMPSLLRLSEHLEKAGNSQAPEPAPEPAGASGSPPKTARRN
jgi:hypothetical protein